MREVVSRFLKALTGAWLQVRWQGRGSRGNGISAVDVLIAFRRNTLLVGLKKPFAEILCNRSIIRLSSSHQEVSLELITKNPHAYLCNIHLLTLPLSIILCHLHHLPSPASHFRSLAFRRILHVDTHLTIQTIIASCSKEVISPLGTGLVEKVFTERNSQVSGKGMYLGSLFSGSIYRTFGSLPSEMKSFPWSFESKRGLPELS